MTQPILLPTYTNGKGVRFSVGDTVVGSTQGIWRIVALQEKERTIWTHSVRGSQPTKTKGCDAHVVKVLHHWIKAPVRLQRATLNADYMLHYTYLDLKKRLHEADERWNEFMKEDPADLLPKKLK